MALAAYEYRLTLSGGSTLTFTHNTRSQEETGGLRIVPFAYAGMRGWDGIVLGENGKGLSLLAWFHEASAAALRTKLDALNTLATTREVGTLEVRGTEDSWENVIVSSQPPPRILERYPEQADGSVGCMVAVRFEQLVPD